LLDGKQKEKIHSDKNDKVIEFSKTKETNGLGGIIIDDSAYSSNKDLHCADCNNWLYLDFLSLRGFVNGIYMNIENVPILYCDKCRNYYFPILTRIHLLEMTKEAKKRCCTEFTGKLKRLRDKFDYCKKFNFKYDIRDYKYLPGLMRPWNDGAITPVFFKKNVLSKFEEEDDYTIEYASDTYGTIYSKKGMFLSFGINRNNKVIVWLKDLEKISDDEKYYFKSYNIKSDHDIGSTFYLSQIEIQYGNLPELERVIQKKNQFTKKLFQQNQIVIYREIDKNNFITRIRKPIINNDKNFRDVLISLNEFFIESIDIKSIRNYLLNKNNIPKKEIEKLRSLKTFERFLIENYNNIDSSKFMNPFYTLYDLRIISAHLFSDIKNEKLRFCLQRLGLENNKLNKEKVYDNIIKELNNSFEMFVL
jgi:hypothetical protein